MSSHAVAEVKRFEVVRFVANGQAKTTSADVRRFIRQHEDQKGLIIEVDPAGIGSCFADRFEQAGFKVRRVAN